MDLTKAPCVSRNLSSAAGKLQALYSAGTLISLIALNRTGSDVWIHIFDTLAEPSNGNTPTFAPIPLVAGGYYESDTYRGFVNGCWVMVSSTADTLTLSATAVRVDAGGVHS